MMPRLIGLFALSSLALPFAAHAQMVPQSRMPSSQPTQWSAGPNTDQHQQGGPYVMAMQPFSSVTVSTGSQTHHIASTHPSPYQEMNDANGEPVPSHHMTYGSRIVGPTVRAFPPSAGQMPDGMMAVRDPSASLMAIMAIPYLYPYGQTAQSGPKPGIVPVPEPHPYVPNTVYAVPGPASVCAGGTCQTYASPNFKR